MRNGLLVASGLLTTTLLCAISPSGRAEPPAAPAFPCGPARHLRTAEELLAALHPEWPRPGVGISPISVELIADVDLVVKSDKLALPAYCKARCTHVPRRVSCVGTGDPCRVPVRFRVNDGVAGVKVDGEAVAKEGVRLQVKAGTHFRLRQRVLEFHPETPYYDPIITVEHGCDVACKGSERRCAATGQCVPTEGDSYCLACTGLSRPDCACRTADGARKPEGTTCTFLSGDYFPSGACKAGRCVITR
jgi:hypothetical protein